MAEKEIDPTLVTVGQPVDGGACFVSFDESPVLPTDATTELDASFVSVGEISTNGYTESKSVTFTDHKGWHGSILLTTIDEETNTFKTEFLEVNRAAAAKLRYGAGNVEVDATTGEVKHITGKPGQIKPVALVFEELESNGHKRRTVFRRSMVSSFDDVAHQKGQLMLYGMTFTASEVDGNPFDVFRAKPVEA